MPQYSGREGDPGYSGPWTSTARPLTSVYTRVPTLQIHRQTEKKTAGSQAGAGRTDCPPSPLTAPPMARSGTRRSLSSPPTSHLFFALLCLRRAPSCPSVWCRGARRVCRSPSASSATPAARAQPARRRGGMAPAVLAPAPAGRCRGRRAPRAGRRAGAAGGRAQRTAKSIGTQCGLRRGGRPQVGNTTGWARRKRWPACGRPCC